MDAKCSIYKLYPPYVVLGGTTKLLARRNLQQLTYPAFVKTLRKPGLKRFFNLGIRQTNCSRSVVVFEELWSSISCHNQRQE